MTVLIVLTAATITAMLLQIVVSAAGAERQRQALDQAHLNMQEARRRVRNQLERDPLSIYDRVLDDEAPRVCDADLTNHPLPIEAGEAWPATCGTVWSYDLTSGDVAVMIKAGENGASVNIESYARTGQQRTGVVDELLPGGADRPTLYGASNTSLADLGRGTGTVTVNGTVYAAGELDPTGATLADGSLLSTETGFTSLPVGALTAVPVGVDGGDAAFDIRKVHAAVNTRANLTSSLTALSRIGCLDSTPSNVGQVSSTLCLRAGAQLRLADNSTVTLPSGDNAYTAWLLIPADSGTLSIYARVGSGQGWPGTLATWTTIGDAYLPGSGVVSTDVDTVLGHCDGSETTPCQDWDDDSVGGVTINSRFTLVVGTPDAPADLYIGGPLVDGDGRAGVLVSGQVKVPAGAVYLGGTLNVSLWVAVLGTTNNAAIASPIGGTRPALGWTGAVLLNEFDVNLAAFTSVSWTTPADKQSPPWFPAPNLGLRAVHSERLDPDYVVTLLP